MGKLEEVIEKLYGVKTRNVRNPEVAQLQVAATLFLRQNPDRLGFLIINLSVNTGYVLNSPDVLATNGILLAANGGFVHVNFMEDLDLPSDAWYGITPGGASNILVIEVFAR